MRISDCSSDVCSSELPTFLGDPSTKSRGVSFGITKEERPHCPRSLNRRELPLQFSDFLIHIPAFKCLLGELIMAGFPWVLECPVENFAGVGNRGLIFASPKDTPYMTDSLHPLLVSLTLQPLHPFEDCRHVVNQ